MTERYQMLLLRVLSPAHCQRRAPLSPRWLPPPLVLSCAPWLHQRYHARARRVAPLPLGIVPIPLPPLRPSWVLHSTHGHEEDEEGRGIGIGIGIGIGCASPALRAASPPVSPALVADCSRASPAHAPAVCRFIFDQIEL